MRGTVIPQEWIGQGTNARASEVVRRADNARGKRVGSIGTMLAGNTRELSRKSASVQVDIRIHRGILI